MEDGTLAFSTESTRGVTHEGGYTVLRRENVSLPGNHPMETLPEAASADRHLTLQPR